MVVSKNTKIEVSNASKAAFIKKFSEKPSFFISQRLYREQKPIFLYGKMFNPIKLDIDPKTFERIKK